MGLFGKRQKQYRLPGNIISLMERFGRFEFDSQASGEDAGEIWRQWAEIVPPFAEADPYGFLIALAQVVLPVGGWAVYGASRTLWEYFDSKEDIRQHPSYKAIMDASIAFLRANRVSRMNVRGYEWDHWLANGGTSDTWLPQLSPPMQNVTPDSPEAWMEIGTTYFENGRYTEALTAYDRALLLNSTYAPAYASKADVLAQSKRYEEALVVYDQAIRFDSANGWPYAGKGMVLAILRRYEEALVNYEYALVLNPTFVGGYIDKGNALTALKRYEEALATYDHAIQLDFTRALAYASKGSALTELERYEEALANYEYALQLDPDNALARAGKNLLNELN